MMFSTVRIGQFEMVAAASAGIVSWSSERRSELGPAMGFAITDARHFTDVVLGPESLVSTEK